MSVAAEPCASDDGNFGKYDRVACDFCAEHGKKHGQCCDSIYRNSDGRDDDGFFSTESPDKDCNDINDGCTGGEAECYPGLTCGYGQTCQLQTNNPNAHAAAALVPSSSSTASTTTLQGVSSLVFVAGAAAMIAMMVVRHRGLLHRHQYNAVDATATRMDV